MRYNFISIGLDIIKKTRYRKCCQGGQAKGNILKVDMNVNWCSNYGKQYWVS